MKVIAGQTQNNKIVGWNRVGGDNVIITIIVLLIVIIIMAVIIIMPVIIIMIIPVIIIIIILVIKMTLFGTDVRNANHRIQHFLPPCLMSSS